MAVDLSTKRRRSSSLDGADGLSDGKAEAISVGSDHVIGTEGFQDRLLRREDGIPAKEAGLPPGVATEPTAPQSWIHLSRSPSGRREFRIENILKDDVNTMKAYKEAATSGYRLSDAGDFICSTATLMPDPGYQTRQLTSVARPREKILAPDEISAADVIRYPTRQLDYGSGEKFREGFSQRPSVHVTGSLATGSRSQNEFWISGQRWQPLSRGLDLSSYDRPFLVYPSMPKRLRELVLRDPKHQNAIRVDPDEHQSLDQFETFCRRASVVFDPEAGAIQGLGFRGDSVTLCPAPTQPQIGTCVAPSSVVPGVAMPHNIARSGFGGASGCDQMRNQQMSCRNSFLMESDPTSCPLLVRQPPDDPRLDMRLHHSGCQIRNGDVMPAHKHTVNQVMFWSDQHHSGDVSVTNVVPEMMTAKYENNATWCQKSVDPETPSMAIQGNKVRPYDVTWPDPASQFKRPRTSFTDFQLFRLREEFRANCYLSEERRLALAKELGLGENQIKIWFQNNRAKLKKASYQKGN